MDEHQSSQVLASENGRQFSEDYRENTTHHPQSQSQSFPGGFIGKHRLQAALTHLNNQITILQVKSNQPFLSVLTFFFLSISSSILFCSTICIKFWKNLFVTEL